MSRPSISPLALPLLLIVIGCLGAPRMTGHLMARSGFPEGFPRARSLSGGRTRYVNLEVLVAIFLNVTHVERSDLVGVSLDKVYREIERARRLYWVNSRCKLNLNVTYLITDAPVGTADWFLDPSEVRGPLRSALSSVGKSLLHYDGVVAIWASSGYRPEEEDPPGSVWGGGATTLRYSSFKIDGAICWLMVHEFHHQLDEFFSKSGYPAYAHADQPWMLEGDFGEHFDFNAHIMRVWPVENWLELRYPRPTIVETDDSDRDGLPDDDPGVPVDERRFGSDPSLADTEGDGLTDLEELMAGIYGSSDPNDVDTDGDGIADGLDPYPLYPLNPWVPRKTMRIDGSLEDGWHLLTDSLAYLNTRLRAPIYLGWDDSHLYIGAKTDAPATLHVYIDAGNDGWFHGKDNYEIVVDPIHRVVEARVWDCSAATAPSIVPVWDERIIAGEDIRWASERAGDGYVMELAIPASAETGLMPREGSKIGLRFEFRSVKGDEGLWGTVFERSSFVDVTLGAKPQLSLLKRVHRPSASTAKLGITLVTSNTGNVPVYDVSVEDVIDESAFKVLSGSTAAEYAKVAPGDSKALTYTLEALAPVADVYALPPATARYEDGAGREQETRSNGVAVHAGVAPDGRPLLVVRKTHSLGEDDRVVTGITVSNVGGGLATDIEVTGTVDGTAFALLSGSPTASYARINPSASESMTYLVRAVKPGAYVLPTASVEYRDQHGRRYVSTSRGTTIASIAAPKPPARHALYLLVVALMAIPAIVALFLLRKPVRAESQPNPPDLAWRVVERSTEAIHELRQHG